ncbi:MAG: TonB-dependent receptor, partial [Pseudomonadota bacterium]
MRKLRRSTLLGMASSLAVIAGAPATMAQEDAGNTASRNLSLPAGPLGDTLLAINEAFGVAVIASEDVVEAKTSTAIVEATSADRALETALNGTGLTFERVLNGPFVITQQAEPAQTTAPSARQETEEQEAELTADTIIVTGTKLNDGVQDTEVSVEIYDSARIEREVLFEFDDLITRAPNVSGNGTTSGLSIRGIQRDGFSGGTNSDTSNIYLDGAPITDLTALGIESLWDVEQVEILRGPQSTFQGRNALAGVVVINTKDPTYEFEGDARARYGELGTEQYSIALSGPIVADQVAARIAVDFQDFDGDIENIVTGENTDGQEGLSIRGKLLIEPKALEGLRADLQVDYIETNQGGLGNASQPGVPADDPAFLDFDPFGGVDNGFTDFTDVETLRFVGNVQYDISDIFDVTFIGTYEDTDTLREIGDIDDPLLFETAGLFDSDSEVYSTELRLGFDTGRLSGFIGGYYYDETLGVDSSVSSPLANLGPPIVPIDSIIQFDIDADITTENFAFFGVVNYAFSEKWEASFGIRYDNERVDSTGIQLLSTVEPADCILAPFLPGIGGAPCAAIFGQASQEPNQVAEFDAVLPRGTLTYNFDEDRSLSFSVQRGYRAGGAFVRNTPAPGGGTESSVETFDPEFVTNFELAFRSEWFGDKLTFNANAFYTDWTDQQVSLPGPTGILSDIEIINVGESELYGVEASVAAEPIEDLILTASIGYLDTQFTDFPFAVDETGAPVNPADPTFANLSGNEFPFAPNFTASIGASYDHQSGVFVNGNLAYTDTQFSDVFNL